MRLRIVCRYAGSVFLMNALFLFISCAISVFNSDSAFRPLLFSGVVTALLGILPIVFVPRAERINNREGLMIVVWSWILSCVIGALPYILWGGEFTISNAWFESVSGYTTTGSSILANIEALPAGLLFWRSATHWLGGMGIIVFVLSVLPSTGSVGMILYRSEMSSLAQENFSQRARQAVRILLTVYVGLTLLETVALLACGMGLFDAITHSFATVATGGFSPRNASVAYFHSVSIEIVIMVFMVLSGIHFGLLFSASAGNYHTLWRSPVVRLYLFLLLLGTVFATVDMHGGNFDSWLASLRYSSFQMISAGTSTGFATYDTSIVPSFSKLLFIFFSLQCACAGSTSGGIKVDRMVILGKALGKQIRQITHPHAVLSVRINDRVIKPDAIETSLLFIVVYLVVVFVATLLLTALDVDILSAFTGVVATMGNVGPGLGSVGSVSNFGHLPDLAKWILSFTMLIGRLEIFALIAILVPAHWK